MSIATLKQVELPEEVFRSLERRAAAHGLSLEEQVVSDLSTIDAGLRVLTEEELLDAIRREREELAARGVWVTNEQINAAKNWGRR